jgi:hypothetical protein
MSSEMAQIPLRNVEVAAPIEVDVTAQGTFARYTEHKFIWIRDFLPWIHAFTFVCFVALLAIPLMLPAPAEQATIWNNFTRFANYIMWGLWFPLVFLSVIFTGRSWCGLLCPMGAASEWANNLGLKRAIPGWIKWPGTPVISFLIITILGQTLGVRDHADAMAELFGGTLLVAILVGFVYGRRKRAWCRHMCPIGLLLGVFSRIGAVQFSPKIFKKGGDRYTEKTICPTMIDLPYKTESRHCIECFRCVHPGKRTGLFFHFRRPGKEIETIREHNPNLTEIIFLFMGTGTALGGFLWLILPSYQTLRMTIGEWFFNHGQYWIANPGPAWLMSVHPAGREVFNWLDFMMITGYMLGWALLVTAVLGVTTLFAASISKKLGGSGSLFERFVELGYQYAPVAMVSLVIGLGTELFTPLETLGISPDIIRLIKVSAFVLGLIWSVWLGDRILKQQDLGAQRVVALVPGVLGSLAIALAWWPAVFGV